MASVLAPRSDLESKDSLNAALAEHLIAERHGKRTGDEVGFSCVYPDKHNNGDRKPSASFNAAKGVFFCRGCGASGTAAELAEVIGLRDRPSLTHPESPDAPGPFRTTTRLPQKKYPRPLVDQDLVEADCYCGRRHPRPRRYPGLGEPSGCWFYGHRTDGSVQSAVLRFDTKNSDGEPDKTFRQFNIEKRTWNGPAGPRPLYRLDEIEAQPGKPVVLVEGEKCADALASLGILVSSTMGGANGVGKTDLSPLAGRTVALWRDADKPGLQWLDAMIATLRAVGVAELVILPIPANVPEKWDAADAIAEGWDTTQVQELIAAAEPPPPLPKRLKVLEFDEALALDTPPRELLLEPWLPAQGLAMIYAARGAGKTHFALAVAYAIATGGEFMRFKAPKPKRVLYIDGEMPLAAIQERLRILASASQVRPEPGYFRLITPDYQNAGIPDLATPAGRQAVEEWLAEGVDLVVLDNLSALVRSGEENAAESWLPIQEFALDLRRRGISCLFVHHAGKGGQQRGTSKREDLLDTIVALRQPRFYKPEDGARFEVHFEKARGFYGKAAEAFEARLKIDESGKAIWVEESLENQTTRMVAALTKQQLSVRKIETELKVHGVPVSKSGVQRHQEKARKLGWL